MTVSTSRFNSLSSSSGSILASKDDFVTVGGDADNVADCDGFTVRLTGVDGAVIVLSVRVSALDEAVIGFGTLNRLSSFPSDEVLCVLGAGVASSSLVDTLVVSSSCSLMGSACSMMVTLSLRHGDAEMTEFDLEEPTLS